MLTFIENESILLFVVRQESLKDTRDHSSAGRASALQAEGPIGPTIHELHGVIS